MQLEQTAWSGEGDFTIRLIGVLQEIDEIALLRVEDAPASRSGAGYNLLANEIYVGFARAPRVEPRRLLRLIRRRVVLVPRMTLGELAARLAATEDIGEADYADDGMLQYLRTERIIPPYQTRGYKLLELVRIYEAAAVGVGAHSLDDRSE